MARPSHAWLSTLLEEAGLTVEPSTLDKALSWISAEHVEPRHMSHLDILNKLSMKLRLKTGPSADFRQAAASLGNTLTKSEKAPSRESSPDNEAFRPPSPCVEDADDSLPTGHSHTQEFAFCMVHNKRRLTRCMTLSDDGWTCAQWDQCKLNSSGAPSAKKQKRTPKEWTSDAISKKITAVGRDHHVVPGLTFTEHRYFSLNVLHDNWGVYEGLTMQDLLSAVKKHIFNTRPGFAPSLRFAIDQASGSVQGDRDADIMIRVCHPARAH